MNEFEKLVEHFRTFPGVGRRQAERFAHFITRQDVASVETLRSLLLKTKETARFCTECQRLTFAVDDKGACTICSSPNRDHSLLMVVEKDADLSHVERSGVYNGLYFVLGGVLPMRADTVESAIRLPELEKILLRLKNNLTEVVLALSLTPEGEYTSDFLKRTVANILTSDSGAKITVLGRGLSVGSELEYSDRETLRHALNSRQEV